MSLLLSVTAVGRARGATPRAPPLGTPSTCCSGEQSAPASTKSRNKLASPCLRATRRRGVSLTTRSTRQFKRSSMWMMGVKFLLTANVSGVHPKWSGLSGGAPASNNRAANLVYMCNAAKCKADRPRAVTA